MEARSLIGPSPITGSFELASPDCRPAEARTVLDTFLDQYCARVNKASVLLVVSELITNAVRHARGYWQMRVIVRDGQLLIEVRDHSPAMPEKREPDLSGAGGMGMHIIDKLTTQCETEVLPDGTGKVIRAVWTTG